MRSASLTITNPAARILDRLTRWAGPYSILLQLVLIGLCILSISRVGLMCWQWTRVTQTGLGIPQFLLQGVRVDLIQLGLILALPVVLTPFFAHRRSWRIWQNLVRYWAVAALVTLAFMELATPSFVMQYDLRPNRLFVEYLVYPMEVLKTLWGGFRTPLILGVVGAGLVVVGALGLIRPTWATAPWKPLKVWLTWPLVVLMVFGAIRSTTGHRPANAAMFALTGDAMVNSLILNSSWSVFQAVYAMKDEANAAAIYGRLTNERVLEEVKQAPWLANQHFPDPKRPTWHVQTPAIPREKPLNLVIVLEESLGATFVESLGGMPVTPELEKLKETGWWFEELYATGTRSVRGIEAVVSGYLPTPARSVVKLSLAQKDFFTLAMPLKRLGYHTEFIYGGESHFDNMRGFFTGNGFQSVIDQKDYAAPKFVGSWGASDEDLFDKAHERLTALHAAGTPSFTLVFTSSNHEPFEFPDGRIELYDREKQTVNNAVKYADHALGEFFRKARASAYWQDTVFLIVADHDNRAYGNSLVPINKFHIPALILGADIQPKRIRPQASQIDLPPTLLSLIGVTVEHPMIGRDFARDAESPGRAMMQFDDYCAWMEGNDVTILRPKNTPLHGIYNPASGELTTDNQTPQNAEKALAHVLLPTWLYRDRLYLAK
ncbi:MAG TPA: LTA synthase family protein [Opitutaceae bacterium]|nr:LTA synthase family protein [Opitutaceae bacterium]